MCWMEEWMDKWNRWVDGQVGGKDWEGAETPSDLTPLWGAAPHQLMERGHFTLHLP